MKTQTKPKTKAPRLVNEVVFEPEPLFDDEKIIQRRYAMLLLVMLIVFISAAMLAWNVEPFGKWIAAVLLAMPVSGLIILLRVKGGE